MKAHSRDASVPFGLGHIARYAPSPEGNICAPIMHFQCKNNFEHLLRPRSHSPLCSLTRRKHLRPDNALSM
nr:MAG TPA: hypothetical protein [Caudoviricetes sp.]